MRQMLDAGGEQRRGDRIAGDAPAARWPSIVKADGVSLRRQAAVGTWNLLALKGRAIVGIRPPRRSCGGNVEGVVGGERDAGMAGGDERRRVGRRLVVDRKAILAHHPQGRPGPHDVETARAAGTCAPRDRPSVAMIGVVTTVVETCLLEAVADHDAALVGLSHRDDRIGQERLRPSRSR